MTNQYPYTLNSNGFLAERFSVQEYIQDELDAREWSYVIFAEKADQPLSWAETLMKGEKPLSEEDALSIEKAFNTEADLWLSLDREYARHGEALEAERKKKESVSKATHKTKKREIQRFEQSLNSPEELGENHKARMLA